MSTAEVWKPSQVVPVHEEGDGRAGDPGSARPSPASPSTGTIPVSVKADGTASAMILKTFWYRRMLCRNLARVTRGEIEEVFKIIDTARSGKITAAALCDALARAKESLPITASPQEELQHQQARVMVEQVLALVETDAEGKFDMEQLRQAMLLGTERDPAIFASRLRGDDQEAYRKVERRKLVKYLRRRKEGRDGCLSLPLTFVWFSVFFALVLCHTRQETVYRLTEAVSRNAAPMVELQTGYPGSLWTWLNGHIQEPLAARYNVIIGGVHVSKASANKDDYNLTALCPYDKVDFFKDVITTGGGVVRKDVTKPDICETGSYQRDDLIWILWPLVQQDVAANISQVHSWWQWLAVDSPVTIQNMSAAVPVQQPERTEVRMLSYNSKLKFYVFYRVIFITRSSGAVEVTEKASAFDAQPVWSDFEEDKKSNSKRAIMSFDFLFALITFCFFFSQIRDLVLAFRNNQIVRDNTTFCRDFFHRWRLLDWGCIFMAVCVIFMYWYQVHLTRGFVTLARGLPALNKTSYTRSELETVVSEAGLSWKDYILQLDASHEQALQIEVATQDSKWFIIIFAICCGLRFFKAFKGNPRMNLVLQTMSKASIEFSHFLIIFVMVFLSFVVIGHMTFGGTIDDFSTFGKAVYTTFLIMMGFVFDEYKVKMFDNNASLGVAWTAVFNIVMGLLLLNMIFAIIFDVYKDVKSGAVDSQSALHQFWEFWFSKQSRFEEMPEMPQAPPLDATLPDVYPEVAPKTSMSSIAVEPGQSLQVRCDQFDARGQAWGSASQATTGSTPLWTGSESSIQAQAGDMAVMVQAPDSQIHTPVSHVQTLAAGRMASTASDPFAVQSSVLTLPGSSMLLQPHLRPAPTTGPTSSAAPISSMQVNIGGSMNPSEQHLPGPISSMQVNVGGPMMPNEQAMAQMGSMNSAVAGPIGSMGSAVAGPHGSVASSLVPVGPVSSMQALQSHGLSPSAAGAMPAGPVSSTQPQAGDFKPPPENFGGLPVLAESAAEGKGGRDEAPAAEADPGQRKSCCKCCTKCCPKFCSKCCWCCGKRNKKKKKKLCEARILSTLLRTYGVFDDHLGDELVGVDELAEMLAVTDKEDVWKLQCIISIASKEVGSAEDEAVSLTDQVRLCSRIDANVREIGAMVTDIAMRAQDHSIHCQTMVKQRFRERQALEQAEAARAMQEESRKAEEVRERTRQAEEDAQRRGLEAKILPESDGNRARQEEPLRDSPEPEPPVGSLDSILEERLKRAAEAQADRHLHLEKAIARLTDRLEPMLKASAEESESLPGRLERLESKVKRLAGKLDPILTNFMNSMNEMGDDPGLRGEDQPLVTRNVFSAQR